MPTFLGGFGRFGPAESRLQRQVIADAAAVVQIFGGSQCSPLTGEDPREEAARPGRKSSASHEVWMVFGFLGAWACLELESCHGAGACLIANYLRYRVKYHRDKYGNFLESLDQVKSIQFQTPV